MDESIKFLLDYNKAKATNIIRNAQAVVGGVFGLFFAIVNLTHMTDLNIIVNLFAGVVSIAVLYYSYVLMKYHEYNDKINMYLIKCFWDTKQLPNCTKEKLIELAHKNLLLSEKNISKAIDDLSNEKIFRVSTTTNIQQS